MKKQQNLDDENIEEKVRCEICGRKFWEITNGHLKTHNVTINEYHEQYPGTVMVSEVSRQKMRDNHADVSGENHPMFGRTGEKCPMYGKGYLIAGEKNGMYGKESWNKGESKDTNESVKKYGESGSKTKTEFFVTEEGQKWLDENNRGENSSSYGVYRYGKDAPGWKGGISNLPYCEKFDEDFKERVRNFFDRKCYVCGKNETDNGRKLDVHHVNYDKMVCCNDVKPLFVPLCKSCHGKTQKDREGWEEFFTISLNYLTKGECFTKKEAEK